MMSHQCFFHCVLLLCSYLALLDIREGRPGSPPTGSPISHVILGENRFFDNMLEWFPPI